MLYRSAVPSGTSFALFGLKLNWEAPMDRTLQFGPVPEWNIEPTRVDKVRYLTASHACSAHNDLCRSES
jgi:hypothetical protein